MNLVPILLLLIVFGVEATLNATAAEAKCDKMMATPHYDINEVTGTWKVYYSFGIKLKKCISIKFRQPSSVTRYRIADSMAPYLWEVVEWLDANLLVTVGGGPLELIMFHDGTLRGWYRALVNAHLLGYAPNYKIDFTTYAIKGYAGYRFLFLLNCNRFSGYLMAKPDDTGVSVKEIMALVDSVLPRERGQLACFPGKDQV